MPVIYSVLCAEYVFSIKGHFKGAFSGKFRATFVSFE